MWRKKRSPKMSDLLKSEEFLKLEKEYAFLTRARDALKDKPTEIESLDFTIVDIETTGLDQTIHEIIEIAAMRVQNKEIKNIFNTLIRPSRSITAEIERLTGINDELVAGYPPASKVLKDLLDFISDTILIAHNAEFDVNFLRHHAAEHLGFEMKNQSICTVKLAKALLPYLENYKLHTVAHYFKIPAENRHRALGDVETTYSIWCSFLDIFKQKNIATKKELETLLQI